MKKLILGTAIALSTMPKAYAGPEEGQFAVLKTEKACDINVPQGLSKSQVYFSKDCSTAFILPPQQISAIISAPVMLAGSDNGFCTALDQQSASLANYRSKITSLENQVEAAVAKLGNANAEQQKALEAQIKEARLQIDKYKKEIRGIFKPYDDMAAVRVKYSLANNVMNSVLAFQTANLVPGQNTGATYPVRFMPAQLADSTLVISNPDAGSYAGRAVLKVNFPGYKPASTNVASEDPNATYVSMGGGLSGIVDISTSVYCRNRQKTANINDIISQSVAINMYYNVKVQTGIKLFVDAKIKTADFLRNISSVIQKGKFQRREFTEDVITGGLEGSINISLDDKGKEYDLMSLMTNTEDGEVSPVSALVAKVIKNYFERAEDKLKQMGIFSDDPAPRAKEVANGSEDVVVGQRRVCHSNSGFLGIGASSSCSTQPIIVQMDRDGVSQLAQNQADNSYIEEQILFETNQTSTVLHSSTFVY
ncbi:MAG: hypothetical protein JSU04_19060 [Bdellovibrionales bacterium]|nr:hypothetical protein [Bdellovibrionales bacterium]